GRRTEAVLAGTKICSELWAGSRESPPQFYNGNLSELERRRDLANFAQRKFLFVSREHLKANMVSAGSAVFVNAAKHCFHVPPGNHRINQPVAASVSEIGFAESKPQEVIRVIRKGQVDGKEFSRSGASFRGVRFQDHRLLRTQKRACTEQLASLRRVLWSRIV